MQPTQKMPTKILRKFFSSLLLLCRLERCWGITAALGRCAGRASTSDRRTIVLKTCSYCLTRAPLWRYALAGKRYVKVLSRELLRIVITSSLKDKSEPPAKGAR